MANLIKTLSIAKALNKRKVLLPVSSATLNINDYEIEIIINGIPSVIQIEFEGAASFSSLMPYFIKSRVSKNSILISNVFKHPFPKRIFNYSGDFRVLNCKIINFDGTSTSPAINNLHDTNKLGESKTNIEDEDLILFSEEKRIKSKQRGFYPPSSRNISNAIKNIEVGKLSKQQMRSKFQDVIRNNKSLMQTSKIDFKEPIKEKLTTEIKTDMQPIAAPTTVVEEKGKY